MPIHFTLRPATQTPASYHPSRNEELPVKSAMLWSKMATLDIPAVRWQYMAVKATVSKGE